MILPHEEKILRGICQREHIRFVQVSIPPFHPGFGIGARLIDLSEKSDWEAEMVFRDEHTNWAADSQLHDQITRTTTP